jgi:D-xylose transport system substrate-binding protein
MKLFDRKRRMLHLLVSILFLSLLIAACDSSSTPRNGNHGKGCKKIGILLPNIRASTRWESRDKPLLIQDIRDQLPGAMVDYDNAAGSDSEQQNQAGADLAKGDCILVVAAVNSVMASGIVHKARMEGVPVIAYDRLIQSKDLSYYVSFDNIEVGKLQGQYIVQHYKEYVKGNNHNVVMINGGQEDNNALLLHDGAHSVLDPLFTTGALKKVYETYTPAWDNALAQSEMIDALTKQQNNIQIAYVASDRMANTVIEALKAVKLNGKVLVTGQDAALAAIQHILTGEQAMTVYKPFNQEALATAILVAALSNGTVPSSLTNGATIRTIDGGNIPAVVETPISVDKSNIASTVIADGFVSKFDVCSGLPAGTNTNGFCP